MSRCSATTRAGKPCTFVATHDGLCTAHGASAGLPGAISEQKARRASQAQRFWGAKGGKPVKRAKLVDFSAYYADPVQFSIDVLGVHPWSRQADFLRAVAAHDRVALKAGQKVSKSNSLAILMLWFVCTRPGARVFFTNSSERQVSMVNYRELTRLYRAAKVPLGAKVHDTAARGIVWPDGREIIGFATDEVDRLGGISGENLLFIVDEASGLPTSLFEGIEGNTAADNAKLIVTGNPLRAADFFYDCFHSKASSWHCMTISSLESPNVVEGREVIRGLAGPKFIKRIEETYGLGSPFWSARVLGEFPSQSETAVIALADVLAGQQRHRTAVVNRTLPIRWGWDIARFGPDWSVGTGVRGDVVVEMVRYRGLDGPAIAAKMVEHAMKHRIGDERVECRIDVIGLGASPYDALVANGPDWIDAVPVNVSERPIVDDHYSRLRDQLWFDLAAWLKTGGAIPSDEQLAGELLAPTYAFDISGKRKVEAKDAIKKRLGRSPDHADSLALAVARLHVSRSGFEWWASLAEADAENDGWSY